VNCPTCGPRIEALHGLVAYSRLTRRLPDLAPAGSDAPAKQAAEGHPAAAQHADATDEPAAEAGAPQPQAVPEKTAGVPLNGQPVYVLCLHTFDGLRTIPVDGDGLKAVARDVAQVLAGTVETSSFPHEIEQPPVGFEPTTCGLQNRCSAD
jgi:hypothetical protein